MGRDYILIFFIRVEHDSGIGSDNVSDNDRDSDSDTDNENNDDTDTENDTEHEMDYDSDDYYDSGSEEVTNHLNIMNQFQYLRVSFSVSSDCGSEEGSSFRWQV